jgi:hypothetical protein
MEGALIAGLPAGRALYREILGDGLTGQEACHTGDGSGSERRHGCQIPWYRIRPKKYAQVAESIGKIA